MLIRLLGDVEIACHQGWRRAGPAKQAGVLAVLALSAGTSVSSATLIHRIWGGTPPDSARNSLYVYISGLRRLLREHPAVDLARGTDGYRLDIAPDAIDVFRMRELVAAAQQHRDETQALAMYRRAREMWRTSPLLGVDGEWAQRIRRGLERERRSVLESLFDIELTAGRHAAIVDELADLVEAEPQAEYLVGQLMWALYRCGRQTDALTAFGRTERVLRESFGVEPTPTLRGVHRQILRQDDADDEPAPAPRQLPSVVGGFTGRADSLRRLNSLVGDGKATVLAGMPGVGKSALAVTWARQVASQFPDGQLFADLRGFGAAERTPPLEVLAAFLRALGVPGREVPDGFSERLALYRTHTANRRLLVVLDDAAEVAQVRPLLPAGNDCVTLVTSRNNLVGLVALEGAHRIDLDELSERDSLRLLRHFLPGMDTVTLTEIANLCGRLPLALRIAASNMAERDDVSAHLASLRPAGLESLAVKDDPEVAVRRAFDSSYQDLDDVTQRAFRILGAAPIVAIGPSPAAVMLDTPIAETKVLLRQLNTAHLVTSIDAGRFAFHDLLGEYARELTARHHDDTDQALRRVRDWYIATARRAAEVLSPSVLQLPHDVAVNTDVLPPLESSQDATDWFAGEHRNINTLIQHAAKDRDPAAYVLAEPLRLYAFRVGDFAGLARAAQQGLDTAIALDDVVAECVMLYLLSMHAQLMGQRDEALDILSRAIDTADRAGSADLAATMHASIANLWQRSGESALAIEHCHLAMTLRPQLSERQRMIIWNTLGIAYRERGELAESAEILRRHVAVLRNETGHKLSPTLRELALTYYELGELAAAWRCATESRELSNMSNAAADQIAGTGVLALICAQADHVDAAWRYGQQALRQAESTSDRFLEAPVWTVMARCQLDTPTDAMSAAERAMTLAQEFELSWVEIDARLAAAEAQLRDGNGQRGSALVQVARDLASGRGFQVLYGRACQVAAEAAWVQGDERAAHRLAEEALNSHRDTGHRPGETRVWRLLARMTADGDLGTEAARSEALRHCQLAEVAVPFTD